MKRLAIVAILGCIAWHGGAQPRAGVANGEAVYLRVGCQACHGTVGHGGAARALAPNTLPLEVFTRWVRDGTPGWTFITGMPAFSAAVLTDAELADVRAYLASVPAPRPADDIPLLTP